MVAASICTWIGPLGTHKHIGKEYWNENDKKYPHDGRDRRKRDIC